MPEVATFTALPPGAVLGALAGALVAVLAAFMVRPARRVVVVPSILVIRAGPASDAVRRGLARWPARLAALLLAIGAAAALSVAAGGPRLAPASRSRTIVAIDASPSMSAGERRTEARVAAAAAIRGLGAGESVMVALAGPGLVPRSPWSTDHAAALVAVESADATGSDSGAFDAPSVLRDAAAILGPEGGRVVLASDMGFDLPTPPPGVVVEGIRVGRDAPNAAIARLAARLEPGRRDLAAVAATIRASGGPVEGTLTLLCGDGSAPPAPSAASSFSAAPGRDAAIRLDHVPLCGPLLRARIASASGPDALAADDEAEVRLPAARRLKVVVAGKGGLFVASALAVQPGVAVERVTTVPARIDADLLVVDDSPGRIPEGVTAFLVNPRPGNGRFEPAKIGEKAPRFEPGLAPDPLVEGVSVADVNVAAAAALRTGPADVVVLASTRGNPLLLRRDLAGERTVALAFPLEATDLGLRAAWPVLVSNVLAWAAEASSDFASAEAAVTQADSDLSARASPPEYTGAVIGAWDRLAASVGDRAARALAAAALVLLMIEFALAQRRPDLA